MPDTNEKCCSISEKQIIRPPGHAPCVEVHFRDRKKLNVSFLRSFFAFMGKAVSLKWLKLLTGFKQKEKITVKYFETEALEVKQTEMSIEGYKASLVKDTSYKGLWKVSFTLQKFQMK